MRMIDEDEVGLKEKQKDYIEMKPEVPRVWAEDLIPNCRLHCLEGPGRGYRD